MNRKKKNEMAREGLMLSVRHKVAMGLLGVLCAGALTAAVENRPIKKRDDPRTTLAIGLLGGYGKSVDGEPDKKLKGQGIPLGINLQFFPLRFLGVEVAGSYYSSSTDGIPSILSAGKLNSLPLQLNLVLRLRAGSRLAFSLLGGAHYLWNQFELDASTASRWEQQGMKSDEKVDNQVGYQAGFGLDIHVTRSLAMGMEGRYFMAKGSGTYSLTDQETGLQTTGAMGDFRLDFIALSLTLKFFLL